MLFNLSFKHKLPDDAIIIDCTSRSSSANGRALSPFNLGPVDLYDGYWSHNLENAYQFASIFPIHDFEHTPSQAYFDWANKGWQTKKAIKYPFGAWTQRLYHWWYGKKLNRLEAQNQIFVPLYKKAVVETHAFKKLKKLYTNTKKDIVLLDFEGYDYKSFGMTFDDVINHPHYSIGQGFVLMMLLEGYL